MKRPDISQRLRSGDALSLDGGTGSELQKRGVDVSRGASESVLGAWSAPANVEAPDAVRAVHDPYLAVGADIITTNSFWSGQAKVHSRIGPGVISMVGTHRWKYCHHMTDTDELYDLRDDPHEMVNLAGERSCAGELRRMRGILGEWLMRDRS